LRSKSSSRPKKPKRSDRYSDRDRPGDNRSSFQRDRDRILFTSAFRRLAGVTQVVSSEEGHIFHNRLTHSLEVAQVGRRLTEKLIKDEYAAARKLQLDPDVVEAACIAHDLGHPPFGHIAEVLLDELAKKELPDGFEGNAQSFRIITKLAFRSPDVTGLNLTRATLNAVLKYPWFRGTDPKKHRKWGAYSSEADEFRFARKLSPPGSERRSPEAEIMDWADDITYSVHDLEDFYRARLIPLHLLARDKRERLRFYDGAKKRLEAEENLDSVEMEKLVETFDRFLDTIALDSEYTATQEQRADLRTLTAGLIGRYLVNTHLHELESGHDSALKIPLGHKREVKMLKELTWHYVINNPGLTTQQFGQRKLIKDLFTIYHEILGDPKDYHVFPASTREQLEDLDTKKMRSEEKRRSVTRIIVDLIAGMTEKHLVNMHRRLTGASLGSALDYF
jgi:dGTPase